jgi:4,5:9,10-diseco-3-hydroxy-5,9,17-trioxoandrosta-1(10),2-diene-4-oate hydrolase
MAGSPPKRLAVASREPRTLVTIDGVELAVHDSDPSSSKPIIFCLHAIGHGGADFTAFEAAFANTHRIITVDWPGQGASGPDAKPVDAQRYTELFTALVDKLQAKRIVILGNSIGGSVAIRYAAAHPENTRALMLCDSAGLDENPGGFIPSLFIGHIAGKMHDGAEGDPDFKAWFRDYYSKILITPEAAAERDAIVESAYEIAPVLAQAWDSFKRSDSDVRDLARRLQMPVFVGWAKNDDLIRWSRNQEAIEQIPHVEVHMFEAGHSAFLETPGPFNDAARKFLDALN